MLERALLDNYLLPAQKLLHYKAASLNTLLEIDRFRLDDAEQATLSKRIKFAEREVEVLMNLIAATDHALIALIQQHKDMYAKYLGLQLQYQQMKQQLAQKDRAIQWLQSEVQHHSDLANTYLIALSNLCQLSQRS